MPAVKTKPAPAAKSAVKKTPGPSSGIREAAVLFKQVSEPTRLQILMLLAEREWHVGAMCEALDQSQPAVSHHIALLRHGRLIEARRAGKNNFYGLTDLGKVLVEPARMLVGQR